MLQALAGEDLPWHQVDVLQVDERIAPTGHEERNLTLLHDCLSARGPSSKARVHAMPVEDDDLDAAAARYARTIESVCGSPPVLDMVHLGLGADGHTASLVPDDAVLDVDDDWVTVTQPYQGRRRMTLTYPVLDGARSVMWLVTGAGKADMLARLMAGDPDVPAGRVRSARAIVFADRDAAAALPAC